ncbi:MAG TPA: PadR family transcriptional regulator [Steroidobacteraceae bacterium]|jgi:PadR family transcriptional regulator PadR|nr:PadR family transcriptional regulator [Steroidobacteraceae bacterium]
MDTVSPSILENLRPQLRRGSLIVAVLAALRVEQYGYTLRKELAVCGLLIEESALYPMLRRLEAQGLLTSAWREQDSRRKRFYRLSAHGATVLEQLLGEWRALNASLERILNTAGTGHGKPQSISARRRGSTA